ncbi:MAG: polysaccharide deacetylase family protein [Acidobacteria bacterium]|nr:polysaccharide deacetylase family protein [Acidobacteriota bacterium]
MLRAFAKSGTSYVVHRTGMDRLMHVIGIARDIPVVIGYHQVVEDFPASAKNSIPAMLISRQMFEHHLDCLGTRYQFIPLDEMGSALESGKKFARPTAAITFDDGYSDVYYNAFPILKRKGIPAAVFVVTEFVGNSQPLLHDRLYRTLSAFFSRWTSPQHELSGLLRTAGMPASEIRRLVGEAKNPFAAARAFLVTLSQEDILRAVEALEEKVGLEEDTIAKPRPLSWEMLVEMQRAGITVGSHTRTHPVLTNENGQKIYEELADSRQQLEERLGVPIRHFAYPDGRFDVETIRAAAAAGYRYAYTTCQHQYRDYPWLTIPRRVLWEKSCLDHHGCFSPAILRCQLNGLFDLSAGCTQNHRFAGKRKHRAAKILPSEPRP